MIYFPTKYYIYYVNSYRYQISTEKTVQASKVLLHTLK